MKYEISAQTDVMIHVIAVLSIVQDSTHYVEYVIPVSMHLICLSWEQCPDLANQMPRTYLGHDTIGFVVDTVALYQLHGEHDTHVVESVLHQLYEAEIILL